MGNDYLKNKSVTKREQPESHAQNIAIKLMARNHFHADLTRLSRFKNKAYLAT